MRVCMIGCSHHSAPLAIREQVAFSPERMQDALVELKRRFSACESVILSTCNRVELYLGQGAEESITDPTQEELFQFIVDFHRIDPAHFRSHFQFREDERVVEHLFEVASSIDSLVVGESQISAQVSEAYENSRQSGFAGPTLHSLFQRANLVAKRVTNETEIHLRRISVPSVAVSEVASEFFERFDDKRIVVIGSGEMGVDTLQYLIEAGAVHVDIVNRSTERSQAVAERFNVKSHAWDRLDSLLLEADLVVSTTGATECIVNEARMRAILNQRRKGNILILDLAVPRDFEASITNLPSVYLYSVDDLQSVCERNASIRKKQLPKARKIIEEEVRRWMSDWQFRSSGATIQALRDQASAIRDSELQRLLNKQSLQDASPEMRQEIGQAMDRVINKLLHSPLQTLRDTSHDEQRDSMMTTLRRLFQIR